LVHKYETLKDKFFGKALQGDEKAAWDSFKFVVKGFLGNKGSKL